MGKRGTYDSKKTKVLCPWCGRTYFAFSNKSKHGCPNYECSEKNEAARMARERVYQKRYRDKKKIQLLNYGG